jgi:phage protein U
MMMALGAFRFSLETAAYQSLARQHAWAWAEQERVGDAPLMQYTGKAAEQLNLDGVILPHFRGGLGQVALMRLQADLGLPLPLISGMGNFFGLYVITDIAERQEVFRGDGSANRVEFSLILKRYWEPTIKLGPFQVSGSGLLGALNR